MNPTDRRMNERSPRIPRRLARACTITTAMCSVWSAWVMWRIVQAFERAPDVSALTVRGLGRTRNTLDEPWHDGWGLTYAGEAGMWLAGAHSVWLIAGMVLSVVLRGAWRLVGVGLLTLWFALWGGNALYLWLVRLGDPLMGAPSVVGGAASAALLVLLVMRLRGRAGVVES